MRLFARALLAAALLTASLTASVLGVARPAQAHDDTTDLQARANALDPGSELIANGRVAHLGSHPSQLGISGCFMRTAPIFVESGVDSVRVWDVRDGVQPKLVGVLPNALFENEAMNCGERVTSGITRRFVLIGVDSVQASTDDIEHFNVGGGELIIVDVTVPSSPRILSRAPGSTSTHTVTCVTGTNCTYAYTAGEGDRFSIFDLRNLAKPHEVDTRADLAGVQPHWSPTAGHKWNSDNAGVATHTGWNGASMWDVRKPARPRLLGTTGLAGQGSDPKYPGWNDFILHNSYRPNAQNFTPGAAPSYRNGNVLLVTEEDYEQTDCTQAGSFQTWWVRRLDGGPGGIVPLDKVELSDLGNFPLPEGAFCSSHWFDWNASGIVAAGFYGGGTQFLDVRNPRDLKSWGYAMWGASEVWDAMWLPVYDARGRQTGRKSNVVYSIDLARGLDVYVVDLPGDGVGTQPNLPSSTASGMSVASAPAVMLLGASGLALLLRRRRGAAGYPGAVGAPAV